MTFPEFLEAYESGNLEQDAAWRAYDIPVAVRPVHIRSALKQLRLQYAGELAIPEFQARYGITERWRAEGILGAWYLWSAIDAGRAVRVPLKNAARRGVPSQAKGQGKGCRPPPCPAQTPSSLRPSGRRS